MAVPKSTPARVGSSTIERGVVGGLLRGGQREQDVAVHAPRLLGAGHGDRIEALDLAGHPDGHVARVELRDLGDAGAPGEQRLPGLVRRQADRRDAADARDCDPFHATGDGIRCRLRSRPWTVNYLSPHDGGGHRRASTRPAGSSAARGRAFELRAAGSRDLARGGKRVRRGARRRARQLLRHGQSGRQPARRARRPHRRDRPDRQARRLLGRALRRRDRRLGSQRCSSASA